ncbi:MAG: DUF3102 domain-containing protein [Verrucomicrobiales bacterium]|nr:DUF3102 domain-containing protein [Verrucomicrobiales bacterium]
MKREEAEFPTNAMMARPPMSDGELKAFSQNLKMSRRNSAAEDPKASLIERINDSHRKAEQWAKEAKESAHKAVRNAFEAGLALIELKAQTAHGDWSDTIKENCPSISQRTVNRYMKLANEYNDCPGELPDLPLREIYSLLSSKKREPASKANGKKNQISETKRPAASNKTIKELIGLHSKFNRKGFQSSLEAISPKDRAALIKTLTELIEALRAT